MNSSRSACRTSEVFGLVFILLTTKIFTNQSLLFVGISGTGAPLSALCSGIAALIIIYISTRRFYHNADSGNILQRVQKLSGHFGKYLMAFILLGYLTFSSAFILNEFSHLTKLIAFPTAPLWFVALFLVIAALTGSLSGGIGLLRISKFIAPFLLATMLLLLISVLCQSDFLNLFPVLGTGIENTLGKGLSGITLYSDILLVFMINPSSGSSASTRNAVLTASVIAAIINILAILTFTAKIPYPLSLDGDFPMYLLLKEVYYGRFFQRIDALFLLASSLCGMFSLSLNFYLITKVLAQCFDITHYQATLFPVAVIMFLLGLGCLPVTQNIITTILFFLALVIMVTVLAVSILTGKGVNTSHEK